MVLRDSSSIFIAVLLSVASSAQGQERSTTQSNYDSVSKVVVEVHHHKAKPAPMSAAQQIAIAKQQKEREQEGQNGLLRSKRIRWNMESLQKGYSPSYDRADISATPKSVKITVNKSEISRLYGSGISDVSCESCRSEIPNGSPAFNMTDSKYGPLVCPKCNAIHDVHANTLGKVDRAAWNKMLGIDDGPKKKEPHKRGSLLWQLEEIKHAPVGKDGYITDNVWRTIKSGESNYSPSEKPSSSIKIEVITDPDEVKRIEAMLQSIKSSD